MRRLIRSHTSVRSVIRKRVTSVILDGSSMSVAIWEYTEAVRMASLPSISSPSSQLLPGIETRSRMVRR
jgi:hypothetical protein